MKTYKKDNEIINLLKVNEISRIICNTDRGQLTLRLRKGETAYRFILDAVELPKDLNKELMEVIYPVDIPTPMTALPNIQVIQKVKTISTKKKLGRPKKHAKA